MQDAKALVPALSSSTCRTFATHVSRHAYLPCGLQFEKYDASTPGSPGGDGEYPVQAGFGWTNGVALALLNEYGWNP